MFNYETLHTGSTATVFFDGDIDFDVTEYMEEDLIPRLESSTDVIFDFEKVPFIDSSGIGVLITIITNLHHQGKNVAIQHISSDVMKVFSLLKLPDILGYDVFVDFQDTEE